jgi:16S rRNA (cytosine967-C5)-methyltransferase
MQEYISAVRVLGAVIKDGKSLDGRFNSEDSALAKQISYGVIRDYYHLSALLNTLVMKPLVGKNADLKLLLLAGLYSVDQLHRPIHTSVNAVVNAAQGIKAGWAKGLVNGVLRNYLRQNQKNSDSTAVNAKLSGVASNDPQVRYNHPQWLIDRLQNAWPEHAEQIMTANLARPPMTLRVNHQLITTAGYLARLQEQQITARVGNYSASAIYLDTPMKVTLLPGFDDGQVSVQDEASQLAAGVLAAESGMLVLDTCAAPGGKTCHILESTPNLQLTALDVEAGRLETVRDNLRRLHLQANCEATDLRQFATTHLFDRILLDAPCSATGIIRRHPDIKLLRRNSDIDKLAATQLALLRAAWPLLTPGGVLVYSTCSILPAENEAVVGQFLTENEDASALPIDADWGKQQAYGRQLFPDPHGHDGFYYARISRATQA